MNEREEREGEKGNREGRRNGYSQITNRLDCSHAKVVVVLL